MGLYTSTFRSKIFKYVPCSKILCIFNILVIVSYGFSCKPMSKSTRIRSGEVPASSTSDSGASTGNADTSSSDDGGDSSRDTSDSTDDGGDSGDSTADRTPPPPLLPSEITSIAIAPTDIAWVTYINEGIKLNFCVNSHHFWSNQK